jgi:hypothetical protein
MILPEYFVTDFLTNRNARLAPFLTDIYVRELVRFTDDCANFIKLFPLQDQFIATLFHEQQLNAMLKSYTKARALISAYTASVESVRVKRRQLQALSINCPSKELTHLVSEIRTLEENQATQVTTFYTQCNNLYPPTVNTNTVQHS